jgi:membrane fusion protein (multidrug efflux system)
MRIATQLVVVAFLAALAGAAWYYQDRLPWPGREPAGGPARGAAARAISVEVAAATRADVVTSVEAVGTALANEAVAITAKTSGLIKKIGFQEGQKIAAGTVLAELDAGETEAKLAELRAARENARTVLERAKALLATRNVPEARVEELQALYSVAIARVQAEEAKLADTVIRAPFSGRLGLRQVSLGALVRPGDTITTLDDTSVIKLDFEVPEIELPGIQPGLAVTATGAAVPDREFAGQVTTIASRVDPVTRSVRVRATVPNADEALKPGMFMTVRLITGRRSNAVVIPEEAVLSTGGQHFVFAVKEGKAQRVRVRLGQRLPGKVEVLDGVAAGTEVIVGGLQQVRDGVPVRVLGKSPAGIAGPATRPAG